NWRGYWAAYSTDGAHIVTANNFGGINVWTSSGLHERQMLVRHAARGAVVSGAFYGGDKYVVTMGDDGSVAIHDVDTRDSVRYFFDLASNASKVNQVKVSPNDMYIAAVSA